MIKLNSLKISQPKPEPLQLARTRIITAEALVEKARMASRAAKQTRKEAKNAARRAKKHLRRAKEELAEARSALTKIEEKLARQTRQATSQRKRLVPVTGSKPSPSKRAKRERHQTKTQDGEPPVVATLPEAEPGSFSTIEAAPMAPMANEASLTAQSNPSD
jgi:chromosome segregation ATPase